MTLILSISSGLLFSFGLYRILQAALPLPSGRAARAIRYRMRKKPFAERLQDVLLPLARLLSRLFPMSAYRRQRLKADFSRLGMEQTPQDYVSSALAQSLLLALLGLVFIPIGAPWMSLITVVTALLAYIDHHILVSILRRRIADEAFIELIWKFLKAGYMENWQYNATFSGTPQGSGISPILANLYLNELDAYMEEYKQAFDRGNARTHNNEFARRNSTYQRYKIKCAKCWKTMSEKERAAATTELKRLRREFQAFPAHDPMDTNYRRIQYTRYADDFLIGIIGSHADAEKVKQDISDFLTRRLKLTMSAEKTLITHGHDKARFLGYDITISGDTSTRKTSKGQSRIYFDRVKLYLPKEKWIGKLQNYGVLKIATDENGKEKWKPLQRDDYMYLTPHEIVMQYNAQIRGIFNYYRLASNVSVLNKFSYVMEYSMYKTLAGKLNITMTKAKLKYCKDGVFTVPYQTQTGEKSVAFYNGGFACVKQALGYYADNTPEYTRTHQPKEIFFRYKAGRCELCGAQTNEVTVHQVSSLKALTDATAWERAMRKKGRKTLVLCRDCMNQL